MRTSILHTPTLLDDLETLVNAERWDVVRSFFAVWETQHELIDKVILFGHFFLDHYFRDDTPEVHREVIKYLASDRNQYFALPRGFAKTTVIQTFCDFSICNQYDKFIVIVEKTFNEASEVIKGIHDEFIDNPRIIQVYGELMNKPALDAPVEFVQKIESIEARGDIFVNGVRVRGKGFNTTIRGLKSREWRPTRIICDDVEEDEHINSAEQRLKYKANYNKGIQPAIDITGSIKVSGTILHQDSLLKYLIDKHGGKIYRAYDPKDPANTLLWPSRWPLDRLERKKQEMGTNAFAQEYLNNPVAEEKRRFKYAWLWEDIPNPERPDTTYRVPTRRITEEQFEKLRRKTTLNGYAMIDAADSTSEDADYTGGVVVFVDPHGNRYRVDVRRERRNINGVIDLIFEFWKKWQPYGLLTIGIEKKAFNDQIVPLFDEEKRRRQLYPSIEELKPMGRSKENRILGALEPLYERGKIYTLCHEVKGKIKAVGDTEDLLLELYDFPASKNDDLMDAEAYQGDIVVVPLEDENKPQPHHNPQDDPFETDRGAISPADTFVSKHDDLDPWD